MRKIASLFLVSMIAGQAWAEEFTIGDLEYSVDF